jgi:hypothetical protein
MPRPNRGQALFLCSAVPTLRLIRAPLRAEGELNNGDDWATIEPRVIHIGEFAIQNRDSDVMSSGQRLTVTSSGVQRVLTWWWFDAILDDTSYLGHRSGCDTQEDFTRWLETDHATQGYKGFKFDLEAAKNPRTSPSVQYGMTHGFVLLLPGPRVRVSASAVASAPTDSCGANG